MTHDLESTIVKELAELKGIVMSQLKQLTATVTRHNEFLFGTDQRDGLIVRTDRLEQSEEQRTFHLRAIWAAILSGGGALVVAIGSILTRLFFVKD